jgi:Na+/melibiose symporter-like transporter
MQIPFLDSYIQLIRDNKNFRYLWLSQVISQLGDWFNLIASAALVANLSGSGLAIGGLFLARLLPPFVLGPFAGVVADRFDRRKILIISDLLRVVVVFGFLLIRSEQDIWLIYTLTIVQLSVSAFFEPARAAILPNIVKREELVTANALSGTTWSTMLALGAALGGLATALFGVTIAFILDALTFLLSAWFVSKLNLLATPTAAEAEGPADEGWQAYFNGLRYLWQNPPILIIALLKAASALAFGGMAVLEVTFAEKVFPLGADGSGTLGMIYFVGGLGTGLAPLIARRITGDNLITMHWAILFTYIASFIGYLMIGWAYTLPILLVASLIRSAGGGTNWVYSSSLLQMLVPNRFLGRVFAFDIAMMTLASSISTLWVGWAHDSLGWTPHQIALALSVISFITALGWIIYLTVRLKRPLVLPT